MHFLLVPENELLAADAGIRAVIAPVVADRPLIETLPLQASDFDGGAPSPGPAADTMPAGEQVARVEDFFRRWNGRYASRSTCARWTDAGT